MTKVKEIFKTKIVLLFGKLEINPLFPEYRNMMKRIGKGQTQGTLG